MPSNKLELGLKIEEVLIRKLQDSQLFAVIKDKLLLVLDKMINLLHHQSKNPYKVNNL